VNDSASARAEIIQGLPNSIISNFQVDENQFLIIHLDDTSSIDNLAYLSAQKFTEITCFEINGQRCAIVQLLRNNQSTIGHPISLLTDRELQIATLVAAGHSNKQIASHLHISEWTVSTHLRRTFMKLGVDSRAAMVYRCSHMLG
jgi:DNA-binding CsgD family transcriptional regulator